MWRGVFRRGFHWSVDRRETLQLVCSLAGMEVAGKSRRKKLPAVGCFEAAVASMSLCDGCNGTGV